MCDTGDNETVEHVKLVCGKYGSDIMDIVHVILTEIGREINEVVGRTGRE